MISGFPRLSSLLLLLVALAAPAQQTITLTSPLDYQVFQRLTRDRGFILIRGHLTTPTGKLETRILSIPDSHSATTLPHNWHKLAVNKSTGDFEATSHASRRFLRG